MSRAEATKRGDHAHRTGLGVNLGLAVVKVLAGWWSGSQALLSDGLHSLSDGFTNGVAWIGFRVGNLPPDEDHHYGHGNFEALAGIFVGVVLTGGGLGVIWAAVRHAHVVEGNAQGLAAIGIAAGSLAANLYLVRITLDAGRELNSPSLLALARDNGSDVLTSLLVMVAVGLSLVGLEWAEPIASALIGALIVFMGLSSAREGTGILTGRVAPDLRESLVAAARNVEGVRGVQRTRVQPVGSTFQVDMEISVDGGLTVAQGHRIAHAVERAVTGAHEHVVEVQVHVNPAAGTTPPGSA